MLLERDAELAVVGAALDSALAGSGSMVLIEGPAGIGKTALLERARQLALELGMRVQIARGGTLERDLAHGVARQFLEPPIRAASEEQRAALLSGAAALAAPVVLPETSAAAAGSAADRRGPVVHGLYWLTANLAAESPLLLLVDDVQWSDPASLRYLTYLARRLDGLRVAVVAAVRVGEVADEDRALAELAAGPSTRMLRPAPLSDDAVEEMVRANLHAQPEAAFATACREATGGVPFLLEELLQSMASSGVVPSVQGAAAVTTVTSSTVAHATLLRLARLSATALPVARGVAVLGRHASVRRVASLAGVDEAAVVRSCDALAEAHILRSGAPMTFVHPIVMASVYDELPAGERSLMHAAAAQLLIAEGEPDEEVAVHLLATGPGTAVATVATLRTAARSAIDRGAPESAIAYLQRCVTEPPPADDRGAIYHELARAETIVRDRNAADDLARALRLTADPLARALIALDLVETQMFGGHWDAALAEVERALGELGDRDAETAARLEVFRAGMVANDPRHIDDFERDRARLNRLASGEGRAASLMAALLASCAVCRIEPAADVAALAVRGLDGSRLMSGEDADAWGPQAAGALAYLGEFDRALAAADAMRAAARRRGSVYGFVRASGLRALVESLRGDLRAVEADLRSAFDLARDHELMFAAPPLLRWSIEALVERPQLDDIAAAVEQIDLDPALDASFSGAWLLEARGRLRLQRGEFAAARADLSRCGEVMTRLHTTNPIVSGWRCALALTLPQAERVEARRLATDELRLATVTGLARPQGIALRTLALLDDGAARIAGLRESAALLDGSDAPLESARTLGALGSALRAAGQRSEADEPLRAALDLAHRCGAERVAARAEDELRGIGARPRRRAASGMDSLTPSEARVAAQAATGMTNREIAQALFVTSKTVENQLSRVYQKLGIKGRDALAAALAG
jgi:DNA-binding CsgD family transcriptional regulator